MIRKTAHLLHFLWKIKNETVQAGTHGTQHAVQLQTDTSGGVMSEPCAPPGIGRFKVTVGYEK
jgi:hypothetical protein